MTLLLLAMASLVLLLVVARTADAARGRRLAATWDGLLDPSSRELLDEVVLTVLEHRMGLEICDRAVAERDAARLRRAVGIVADFAPGLQAGLDAMSEMSRSASALVPLPPVRPLVWRAWQLRGLSGLALALHAVLVAAVERLRLRIWVLTKGLAWSLGWLSGASSRVADDHGQWAAIQLHLHDLAAVGDQAELTFEHVVRSLDAIGKLVPAGATSPAIRKL